MEIPKVSNVAEADRDQAINTLLLAFSSDPFVRWMIPNAHNFLQAGEAFDAFGGGAIDAGTGFEANGFQGVALWMPPGVAPDEERFGAEVEKYTPKERQEAVFRVLEKMEEYHPEGDVWYLPIIGVDPSYQGLGVGSQLMKAALERVDAAGLPAYLESSNPRNMSLYERCGFETIGVIQIEDSPPVHPMIRQAR